MWTATSEGREFIKECAKIIVADLAPEELSLFDELAQEYFSNPKPPNSSSTNDDLLGFGLSDVLIAFTPAVIASLTAILNYILTDIVKASQDETANTIKKEIHRLFNGKEKNKPTSLTKDQLEFIKNIIRRKSVAFGIKDERAKLLADAIVGTIALKL